MAIRSDSQKKAVAKYNAKAYEQILLRVKAGESEKIKAHAAMQGETVNGFIKRAITETMQRDQAQPIEASGEHEPVAEEPTEPKSFIERAIAEVECDQLENTDISILREIEEPEPTSDCHSVTREIIEEHLQFGTIMDSIPDWYVDEVADNSQKRERLLDYAMEHEDENSCCKQIVERFRGMM